MYPVLSPVLYPVHTVPGTAPGTVPDTVPGSVRSNVSCILRSTVPGHQRSCHLGCSARAGEEGLLRSAWTALQSFCPPAPLRAWSSLRPAAKRVYPASCRSQYRCERWAESLAPRCWDHQELLAPSSTDLDARRCQRRGPWQAAQGTCELYQPPARPGSSVQGKGSGIPPKISLARHGGRLRYHIPSSPAPRANQIPAHISRTES